MTGFVQPTVEAMVREYIARDPRTGLPIATGRRQTRKTNQKERIGPWLECTRQEILDLSTGELSNHTVDWNGGRHTLTRVDGVQGLGRLKGGWADRAHASLLSALESDEVEIRVAALEVLPTVAEQRSDELFDWLSVLLDDDDVRVRKAASLCLEQAAPSQMLPQPRLPHHLAPALRPTHKRRRGLAFAPHTSKRTSNQDPHEWTQSGP